MLTAVKDYKLKAIDQIMISSQETHLTQSTVVCIFIESIFLGKHTDIFLHREGVVISCVVRLGDIVPVGNLIVMIARHIEHWLFAIRGKSGAGVAYNQFAHLFPIFPRDRGIARAVTTEQHHIYLLIPFHICQRSHTRTASST